jgi:hypothetical protein
MQSAPGTRIFIAPLTIVAQEPIVPSADKQAGISEINYRDIGHFVNKA